MTRGDLHLTPRVVKALYTEAMLLADEARSYFEMDWASARAAGVTDEVAFSCESLKISTRLMHCIAWVLNQKHAAESPEAPAAARAARRPPGRGPESEPEHLLCLPDDARILVGQSIALHRRLERLHDKLEQARARCARPHAAQEVPPVRAMQAMLRASF